MDLFRNISNRRLVGKPNIASKALVCVPVCHHTNLHASYDPMQAKSKTI